MNSLSILSVFLALCCVVYSQNDRCRTPAGIQGRCVSLYSCSPVLTNYLMANSANLSPKDRQLLQQSYCGFDGQTPKICCPQTQPPAPPTPPPPPNNQCLTPEFKSGRCIGLYSCPALVNLLNPPVPEENIDFVKRSTCNGAEEKSVCCGPAPTFREPQEETKKKQPPVPPPPPNNQCLTPEFKSGRCIGLHSCPALLNLLKPPVPEENIDFVKRSICNGPDEHSVCCGPAPTFKESQQETGKNQHCMSAFPPDPSSNCCGVDANNGNKIYGGTATSIDQYPWMALIEYEKNNMIKVLCAGSLISGRYILTAAHCVVGPVLNSGKPIRIRLAEYDIKVEGPDCAPVEAGGEDCTYGTTVIPIEKLIPHPQYDPTMVARYHDIALIRMSRVAVYSDFIRPICLPKTDIKLKSAGFNFTTAGWGAVSLRSRNSNIKLHVDLPYVPLVQCQPAYGTKVPLWKGQICAGGVKNKDSCKGDSGGPLMFENDRVYEVSGIVSFGQRECGLENVAAVYTHVYEYDSWIRSNIVP